MLYWICEVFPTIESNLGEVTVLAFQITDDGSLKNFSMSARTVRKWIEVSKNVRKKAFSLSEIVLHDEGVRVICGRGYREIKVVVLSGFYLVTDILQNVNCIKVKLTWKNIHHYCI